MAQHGPQFGDHLFFHSDTEATGSVAGLGHWTEQMAARSAGMDFTTGLTGLAMPIPGTRQCHNETWQLTASVRAC